MPAEDGVDDATTAATLGSAASDGDGDDGNRADGDGADGVDWEATETEAAWKTGADEVVRMAGDEDGGDSISTGTAWSTEEVIAGVDDDDCVVDELGNGEAGRVVSSAAGELDATGVSEITTAMLLLLLLLLEMAEAD